MKWKMEGRKRYEKREMGKDDGEGGKWEIREEEKEEHTEMGEDERK